MKLKTTLVPLQIQELMNSRNRQTTDSHLHKSKLEKRDLSMVKTSFHERKHRNAEAAFATKTIFLPTHSGNGSSSLQWYAKLSKLSPKFLRLVAKTVVFMI